MQKRTVEIAVGIFVLLGIAALIMLALRVSGLNDIYMRDDGYELTAQFVNVGGLKPKARVSIAGVQVGRVTEITFDRETHRALVKMSIDREVNNLPEDTQARILTAGLLGDNYIGLTPGMNFDEFLAPGGQVTDTHEAIVLEDLIAKFFTGKASGI
jgi:phospholipid/cholesterol/gamma-HCH transport system substrate-binding protein